MNNLLASMFGAQGYSPSDHSGKYYQALGGMTICSDLQTRIANQMNGNLSMQMQGIQGIQTISHENFYNEHKEKETKNSSFELRELDDNILCKLIDGGIFDEIIKIYYLKKIEKTMLLKVKKEIFDNACDERTKFAKKSLQITFEIPYQQKEHDDFFSLKRHLDSEVKEAYENLKVHYEKICNDKENTMFNEKMKSKETNDGLIFKMKELKENFLEFKDLFYNIYKKEGQTPLDLCG